MAQVPLWLVWPQGAQMGGDLLGAPFEVEFGLDFGVELRIEPQLRVRARLTRSWARW
ncbi:hypothetical protein [Streptomyces sp. NPDC004008]